MPKGAAARSWRSRSEVGPILTEAPAGSQVIGWKIARKSHLDRSRKQGWKSLCFTARKRSAGVDDILCLTPSDYEDGSRIGLGTEQIVRFTTKA